MSATHPISCIVFDQNDVPIFSTSTFSGYIPRKSEQISIDRTTYIVTEVNYIYGEHCLEEVHIEVAKRKY